MPPAAKRPARGPGAYSAPALEKGLDILELLAEVQKPLSTRAIAERLGRSKSEIFRTIFVLVERGYLMRDAATDLLVLSSRLFDLGIRTPRPRQLVEVAVPAMEELSDATGLSAHLVVVNRGETVVIATTTGSADIGFTLRLGYRRPALDATSGQIIMAFQSPIRRTRMIADSLALSPATMDRPELLRQLDGIAKRGFLIGDSHDVVGVTDIGAPVLNNRGGAIACVVVAHLNRYGVPPAHDSVLAALLGTCRTISGALN